MSVRITCSDCGRPTIGRTQAVADYAHRRHSCKKELTRQATARRVRARAQQRNGVRRDCQHPIARHEHGTRLGYVLDRCRCAPCKDAVQAYEKARVRAKAYGRPERLVDAEPVRQHLRDLMAQGTGFKHAAERAGIRPSVVATLLYGRPDRRGHAPQYRVDRTIAAKLLAIRHDPWTLRDGALVDATGTRRRVQALVAVGWSLNRIATELGIHRSNFTIATDDGKQITARLARAVRDLYEQWWTGPTDTGQQRDRISISRSLTYAREHRFLPPLAWDDDTIDDPTTQPMPTVPGAAPELDEALVLRILAGDRALAATSTPERVEAVRRMAGYGRSASQIAAALGMSRNTVSVLCSRNGIRTRGAA